MILIMITHITSWQRAGLATLALLACAACTVLPVPTPDGDGEGPGASEEETRARYLTAVGKAGPGPESPEQRRQADVQARRRLAEDLEQYARDALAGFFARSGGMVAPDSPLTGQFAQALATELATELLTRTEPHRSWRPKEWETRVEYRVSHRKANEMLVGLLPKVAEQIDPFSVTPEVAAGRLDKFLRARLTARIQEDVRRRPPAETTAVPQQVPQWVRTGQDPDYPPGEYLSAIGLSDDGQRARREAYDNILSQVHSTMLARSRTLRKEAPGSAFARNVAFIDLEKISLSRADLRKAEAVARWYDAVTATHYVMCAAHRAQTAQAHTDLAREAGQRAADLLESSSNQRRAGNFSPAVTDALEAVGAARRAVREQCVALGAAPPAAHTRPATVLESPLLALARTNAEALLRAITVEVESGNNQWTPPGGAPAEPLVVRVTATERSVPVSGMPLRFRTVGADPTELAVVKTGPDGRARLRLTKDITSRHIVAEPAIEKVTPRGLEPGRFAAPAARFELVLRSPENVHFVVHVDEQNAQMQLPPRVGPAVRQALRDMGYGVVREDKARENGGALKQNPEPADILRAFKPLREEIEPEGFLLIAFGSVKVEHVQDLPGERGSIPIYHASYKISVYDPAGEQPQKPLLRIEGKGRGAYTNRPRESAERALTDAATSAARKMEEKARKLLGLAENR